MVCGNVVLCLYHGDHGCFYNGACGVNAPLSAVAGRVFLCVSRDNSLCINGKRTDGILQLACNGDMTSSIKVCGDWPDWPVSDHFGRQTRSIHTQDRQERLHGEREWWAHGKGGGGENLGSVCVVRSKKINRECCCFKMKMHSKNKKAR